MPMVKDYKLKTFTLTPEKFKKSHTAIYPYEVLLKVFEKWKINNNNYCNRFWNEHKNCHKHFNEIAHVPSTAHKSIVVTQALEIQYSTNDDIEINSCLLMLERLVALKKPITYVMMPFKDSPTMIQSIELNINEEIIPLLTLFNMMTVHVKNIQCNNYSFN